jgi:hypothetical protein
MLQELVVAQFYAISLILSWEPMKTVRNFSQYSLSPSDTSSQLLRETQTPHRQFVKGLCVSGYSALRLSASSEIQNMAAGVTSLPDVLMFAH